MNSNFPIQFQDLNEIFAGQMIAASFVVRADAAFCLLNSPAGKRLAMLARGDSPLFLDFHGTQQDFRDGFRLLLAPADLANSRALRKALPYLAPQPLGLQTSAGMGDRLGLATPGHVLALQRVSQQPGSQPIAPIFAQQSIRENTRTGRTPEQVLSDATWGAFAAGWQAPVGADADHLKTPADIDACVAAGYSFYTLDPGDYVDSSADLASEIELEAKLTRLPWETLETSASALFARYTQKTFDLGERSLHLTREEILRAAVKVGHAIAHVVGMYRHLMGKGLPFELEVSVDETETPTHFGEHFYITSELHRLGVQWVSLAPRFVGRFEKGVDYIGDLSALAADLAGHALLARQLGPYKLSLHSGSDKFSVYPLACQAAGGLVHLKTAGTSYLEALRLISSVDVPFFRELFAFARQRYLIDRTSYHVSADLEKISPVAQLADQDLPALLEQFDARQVFHVTFGSVLSIYGSRLLSVLNDHENAYQETLARHFVRHLEPFARRGIQTP